MKHRQFKTECTCMAMVNGKTFSCNDLREIKNKIYTLGTRGETYRVEVIERSTEKINDIYLMRYAREGPIFTKQIFSRWKENKRTAKVKQYNIFFEEQ